MASTSKPSGLAITRDGNLKFVVSWKITDKDYGAGHELRWRVQKSGEHWLEWTTLTMGAKATSKTITLTPAQWHPDATQHLLMFEFQVRGKRTATKETKDKKTVTTAYDWSDWAKKTWSFDAPPVPKVTVDLNTSNKSTFTWDIEKSNTDARPFKDAQWQTIIKKACTETDGSKLTWASSNPEWQTGTGSQSGSKAFTEDTVRLAADSYTRWFRIHSRGAAGNSIWRYAKHVYARPYAASIKSVKASIAAGITTCTVTWTAKADAAHPIDETSVQYAICTPAADLEAPAGASWTEANISKDTSGTDKAVFSISAVPGEDQCLFVRVLTKHDSNITYSAAALAAKGTLSQPSSLSVQTDDETYRASVSAVNNSNVPDSQLAVVYRNSGANFVIGIIGHGQSSLSNIQCPQWKKSPSFGVYAFQGNYAQQTGEDGVTVFTVTKNMKSEKIWAGGSVPVEPKNVTVEASKETTGEAILSWDWSWADATAAEISWSQNPNAWESTEEPQTFTVESIHTSSWRISGLEVGVPWYFRVRLLQSLDDTLTYGPYCDAVSIVLSSAPNKPMLVLTPSVVNPGGELTASWGYVSTDGSGQGYAEICEAIVSGDETICGDIIAHAETEQNVSIDTSGWEAGQTVALCVRVRSLSGTESEWSDPASVYVAEPVSVEISSINLSALTVTDSDGNTRAVVSLTAMPVTLTATGAGEGGTTTVLIERSGEYQMIRPDGSIKDGYDGETVAIYRQQGEGRININTSDLSGTMDDGASYILTVIAQDSYGQTDTEQVKFEVHWAHQASIPGIAAMINETEALIMPIAPDGYANGDTCDLYRLSADKPKLVYKGAEFGRVYLDPYPAFGINGGYRAVCVTANGDYITEDNRPAWADITGGLIENKTGLIHFGGQTLEFGYNTSLNAAWKKDFKETKYLGGTVRGDWNAAVSRTGTINAVLITDDAESIRKLRDLADYAGICHVRTQDGSSYSADIQVSANQGYSTAGKIEEFTLTVTRVESEEPDGSLYTGNKIFVATHVTDTDAEVTESDEAYDFAAFEVDEQTGTLQVILS